MSIGINKPVTVIGGGLAGCESAWQLIKEGLKVKLYEMRPTCYSPAHKTSNLAELVCSNSLRSKMLDHAAGLLKEEMRRMDSLIMAAADDAALPAGSALAVDRLLFSHRVEERLLSSEGLEIIRQEIASVPTEEVVIVASGPLTSDSLACSLAEMTGQDHLYFYDAISPVVEADSVDRSKVFRASRYGNGEGDYLNCPLTRAEYASFHSALLRGKEVPRKSFEDALYFEGCLPIEVMAGRGERTLVYGPMKPVGLIDPKTGKKPYAVVQLRQENSEATLFNLVGFQTKLTWPEQKRIFRMIPGLERAEFARYGSIHRNTFLNAPALLNSTLQLRGAKNIFFAGQITGVEGYIESAAMGLAAGIFSGHYLRGRVPVPAPRETAIGSLIHHLTNAEAKTFQPMNVNFGLFPPLEKTVSRKDRGPLYAERALEAIKKWKEEAGRS